MKFVNVSKFFELVPFKGSRPALGILLSQMTADGALASACEAAYMLATTKHETNHTYMPIHEIGTARYFEERYGKGTRNGVVLGNMLKGDGATFHGRGFVQVTGRKNYLKLTKAWNAFHPESRVDFTQNPDLLLKPEYAYFAMTYGMHSGLFTGRKLSDYIVDGKCDYVNARRIINGTDRAEVIAGYAKAFEDAISRAYEPEEQAPPESAKPDDGSVAAQPEDKQPSSGPPAEASAASSGDFINASVNSGKRLATWLTQMGIGVGTMVTTVVTFSKEHPILVAVVILAALAFMGIQTGFFQSLLHKADEQRRSIAASKNLNNVR